LQRTAGPYKVPIGDIDVHRGDLVSMKV
jgi:hypothetical protein